MWLFYNKYHQSDIHIVLMGWKTKKEWYIMFYKSDVSKDDDATQLVTTLSSQIQISADEEFNT